MFIPENSWIEVLREANRHREQGVMWFSPKQSKPYRIADITNVNKPIVRILRTQNNTIDNVSEVKVFNLINHLIQNNERMLYDRNGIPGASMDVASFSSIVHLHPWLDYSTVDNVRYIIVRKFPKVSLFGIATFSPEDGRQLQRAARNIRRGQWNFRNDLLELYEHTCCISGTKLDNVLDAAHIIPHSFGGLTDASNGLLLRADLHNLFDDGLIGVNPITYKIEVSESLKDSEYWELNGSDLRKRNDPANPYPSIQTLIWKQAHPNEGSIELD